MIYCCCYHSIDWVPIFALLVSLSTLILGIIAYKKFLYKQFRENQLNEVCDLIKQINGSYNVVHIKNADQDTRWWYTLFDIAEMKTPINNGNFYTWGLNTDDGLRQDTDIFPSETLADILDWNFLTYHNNPMIPINIAKVLKKFNILKWKSKLYSEVQKEKEYVIIGRKINITPTTPCHFYEDKKTWKEFKNTVDELKREILKWGKDNGIDDLNVSVSHHFVMQDNNI